MKTITDVKFPLERALYGEKDLIVDNCRFDGIEDGESALKEGTNIKVINSYFNLRYPMWHDKRLSIQGTTLTDRARAALWYCKEVKINDTIMYGIKALRECSDIQIKNSRIASPEFGWRSNNIEVINTQINDTDYLFFECTNLKLKNVDIQGKYSFQYVKNMEIDKSTFDTKDAFWHTKNVTVKNSVIKGEYLGWYSEGLTLVNCKIIGTQPLCYCKKLKLVNCRMIDTDLAFEYSDVEATIKGNIDSIKNPKSGFIELGKAKKVILENSKYPSTCKITQTKTKKAAE